MRRSARVESDQSQLRQRDCGKQSVSVRDGHQYRRFERDDFSGRDQRDRIQPEWDHCSGDTDGRTEHELHRHVRSAIRRKCERQRHDHFECIQSDPDHSVVGHRSCARCARVESDESQLRQRDSGKQSGSLRDGHQYRRFQRDDFSGRDQRNRIQPDRDHCSGHIDGRARARASRVTFTPQSAGSASGNVTITSNASNPTLTIPLSGTGAAAAGQLTVTPTTLGLGSVVVGTSETASGSLTASGANVTVTAVSSNNSVFSVGGLALPVTIPAGQSASFTVTFSPQVSAAVERYAHLHQ